MKMYPELKKALKLLWEEDDLMGQETLFALQEHIGELTLKVAEKENTVDDLVKSFPWLYSRN